MKLIRRDCDVGVKLMDFLTTRENGVRIYRPLLKIRFCLFFWRFCRDHVFETRFNYISNVRKLNVITLESTSICTYFSKHVFDSRPPGTVYWFRFRFVKNREFWFC